MKEDLPAPPSQPLVENEEQPQPAQEIQPSSQDEDVEMNDASPEEAPTQPNQNRDEPEHPSEHIPSAPELPEHEMSDNAPEQPGTNGIEPTSVPEAQTDEQAANEAIIASIIAQDLALLDQSQEMDTSGSFTEANGISPPPPMIDEEAADSPRNEAEESREVQEHHSGSEDSQMEGSPIVESQNDAPEETNAQTSQEEVQREEPVILEPPVTKSDLILPCDQVYYFVQEFDADKQTVETVGAFFARSSCNVREQVRKTLGLSEDQGYNFWSRRKAVASVHSVSSSHKFRDLINDVGCIIFGKTIPKRR